MTIIKQLDYKFFPVCLVVQECNKGIFLQLKKKDVTYKKKGKEHSQIHEKSDCCNLFNW